MKYECGEWEEEEVEGKKKSDGVRNRRPHTEKEEDAVAFTTEAKTFVKIYLIYPLRDSLTSLSLAVIVLLHIVRIEYTIYMCRVS